jgi:hypothetical protein
MTNIKEPHDILIEKIRAYNKLLFDVSFVGSNSDNQVLRGYNQAIQETKQKFIELFGSEIIMGKVNDN